MELMVAKSPMFGETTFSIGSPNPLSALSLKSLYQHSFFSSSHKSKGGGENDHKIRYNAVKGQISKNTALQYKAGKNKNHYNYFSKHAVSLSIL